MELLCQGHNHPLPSSLWNSLGSAAIAGDNQGVGQACLPVGRDLCPSLILYLFVPKG
ncbi:hypothetical protein [Fulvivirga sedimenti]|uniref:Uncharacterized protein n=1 Tax=Fulvivirga sedimenti TaxID=2879465 RepID=A0A9X1HVN2_9BACT|nr:hypothetical protein [Fulvivirga sedimenti]MCA6075583.1 hypothetical protein [Fulvivirga sedimenti]MCA6076760.1 hypothetical protein [Fulvivirga sedimenti]MCA6077888.1 hypothetical protein [Fulvivirga sedimenti]